MTTLNDALVAIIQKTQGAVESGVSFLSEQIPDVIQQLLMWKFYEAVVLCAMLAVFQLVVVWGAFKTYKITVETQDAVPFAPYIIIMGFCSLFITGFAVGFLLKALQIYIAPKVWLIEYAASLAK